MLVEFKKLLALQHMRWEFSMLYRELANHEFQVNLKGMAYKIRIGSFGTT
jgi:hypothetical protein